MSTVPASNSPNSALDAFVRYSWPGNVREMENLVERLAIIFDEATIDLLDLSPYLVHGVKELETQDRTAAGFAP